MTTTPTLTHILLTQWQEIRRLTYAYLALLEREQLALTLPFPASQSIGYQFWCMVGAHEYYLNQLEQSGEHEFHSSLDDFPEVTPALIQQQLQAGDARLTHWLQSHDPFMQLANGQSAYQLVFQMIKHEMHHHGQLINFLFCHRLPIPQSWQEEWALAHE